MCVCDTAGGCSRREGEECFFFLVGMKITLPRWCHWTAPPPQYPDIPLTQQRTAQDPYRAHACDLFIAIRLDITYESGTAKIVYAVTAKTFYTTSDILHRNNKDILHVNRKDILHRNSKYYIPYSKSKDILLSNTTALNLTKNSDKNYVYNFNGVTPRPHFKFREQIEWGLCVTLSVFPMI